MNAENFTLATAFNSLAKSLKQDETNADSLHRANKATKYINGVLGLSPVQCRIVAVMLDHIGDSMSTVDLANNLNISKLLMLGLQQEITDLVDRKVVMCIKDSDAIKWIQQFVVSPDLIASIRANSVQIAKKFDDFTLIDLLGEIESVYQDIDYSRISFEIGYFQIKSLIDGTMHLKFSQKIKALDLCDFELHALLLACAYFVIRERNEITSIAYSDILQSSYKARLKVRFRTGTTKLITDDLLIVTDPDDYSYSITQHAIEELLEECKEACTTPYQKEDVSNSDDDDTNNNDSDDDDDDDDDDDEKLTDNINQQKIVEKQLFFNRVDGNQIKRLYDLLSESNFANVQQRMREAGMRPGFTAIIHGQPGTGKTECILQISRSTGREIIQVNLATLRDKWVGNSEKNIQSVFDNYKTRLKKAKLAPILLFNEADGIFANRISSPDGSVDQMENTMQNIILQNMETFEGILIATTNMTENFDGAFERRFLYKIELHRPDASVREKIWLSHIPQLTAEQARTLATRFELSGGQIENVARKQLIDFVLYGADPDVNRLAILCREELSLVKTVQKRSA